MVLLFEIWSEWYWYCIFIYLYWDFIILYVAMRLICVDVNNKWGHWKKVQLFLVYMIGFSISYSIVVLWCLRHRCLWKCFCLFLRVFDSVWLMELTVDIFLVIFRKTITAVFNSCHTTLLFLYRLLGFVKELFFSCLSANPTKWSNTLKQFVGKIWRIVWVCLTILCAWLVEKKDIQFFLQ